MTAKHRHKQAHANQRDPRDPQRDAPGGDESATERPGPEAEHERASPAEAEARSAPQAARPDDGRTGDGTAEPTPDGADAPDLVAELESYRDRHLRLAAEYDNFRKRTERERASSAARAQGQLVERLLDALDDLARVAAYDADTASAESILEGVRLVERKLLRTLEAAGLETIDASDQPFDPEIHEALAIVGAEEREQDDTVADVFQKGYRFQGNLIRPARVRVRRFEG